MAVFLLLPIVWAFAARVLRLQPAAHRAARSSGSGSTTRSSGLEHFKRMFDFSNDGAARGAAVPHGAQGHAALRVHRAAAEPRDHAAARGDDRVGARPLEGALPHGVLPAGADVGGRRGDHLGVRAAPAAGPAERPDLARSRAGSPRSRGRPTPTSSFLGVPIALVAIIVAYLWQDIGYNLVIFIAALQAIPDSVKDAARVDGASAWQTFRYITLPLLKPTILLASVLTMISSFQVFDLFQVMTNGGPDDQTRALSLDIYESAFRYQRMGGRRRSRSCCSCSCSRSRSCSRGSSRRTGSTEWRRRSNDRRQRAAEPRRASRACRGSGATRSAASPSTRCSRSSA